MLHTPRLLKSGLIDRVVLHPGEDGPEIELVGDIARMVELILPKDENAASGGGF